MYDNLTGRFYTVASYTSSEAHGLNFELGLLNFFSFRYYKSQFCKFEMGDSDREELTVSLIDGTHVISISKSVVERSFSVISNLIKFTDVDVESNNPTKPPEFITKLILLDFIEILEKEDYECAHLVLYSHYYLIDFLKAADFLGDENVLNGAEERVKERINGENWKEFFDLTVNSFGLRNITNETFKYLKENEGHFPFLNREVLNDIQRRVEIKVSEELEKANVKNNNETTGWDKVREVVRKCIFIDNSNGFERIFEHGDEGIKINLYEDEDDTWKKFCEVFENAIRDQDSWSMLQEIILENIPVM